MTAVTSPNTHPVNAGSTPPGDQEPLDTSSPPPASNESFWKRLYPGPLIRAGSALLGGWLLSLGHHRKSTAVVSAVLGAVVFGTLAHVGLRIQKEDGFHAPDKAFPAAYQALRELLPEGFRKTARGMYGVGRDMVSSAARNFDEWEAPNYVGGSHHEVATNYLPEPTIVRLGVGKHKILEGALTELKEAKFLDKNQGEIPITTTEDGRRKEVNVAWSPDADTEEGSLHQAEMTFLVPLGDPNSSDDQAQKPVKAERIRFTIRRPQIGPLGTHVDLELAKEAAVHRAGGLVKQLMDEGPSKDPVQQAAREEQIKLAYQWLREDLGVAVNSLDPEHPRRETLAQHLANLETRPTGNSQYLLKHLADVIEFKLPRVQMTTSFRPTSVARGNAKALAAKVLQDARALRDGGHPGALADVEKDAMTPEQLAEHDARVTQYIEKRRGELVKLSKSDKEPFARVAEYLLSLPHTSESLWTLEPLINLAEVRAKNAATVGIG